MSGTWQRGDVAATHVGDSVQLVRVVEAYVGYASYGTYYLHVRWGRATSPIRVRTSDQLRRPTAQELLELEWPE